MNSSNLDPQTQKQIPNQLDSIEVELSQLRDRVDCLVGRLSSIMLNEATLETVPKEKLPDLVPIAESIRNLGEHVREIRSSIDNILDRIQL